MAGITPPSSVDENNGAIVSEYDLPAAAAHLTETFGSVGAKEILRGELVDDSGKVLPIGEVAARVDKAHRLLERITRDEEYRRQYLSGSRQHREEVERISATIAIGEAMMDKYAKSLP